MFFQAEGDRDLHRFLFYLLYVSCYAFLGNIVEWKETHRTRPKFEPVSFLFPFSVLIAVTRSPHSLEILTLKVLALKRKMWMNIHENNLVPGNFDIPIY